MGAQGISPRCQRGVCPASVLSCSHPGDVDPGLEQGWIRFHVWSYTTWTIQILRSVLPVPLAKRVSKLAKARDRRAQRARDRRDAAWLVQVAANLQGVRR